ncbi:MAG: metal-binding protein [Synechococcaceae cyanobacterium]|nr:metal-binding protein [Synechococcaceae cyanobacterium]
MASGRRHDRTTGLLALPFGLLWWPALGPAGAAVATAGFLLGGLWLSPDLDTRSNAVRRWGPLGSLWWPYRRLLRHRSFLSHSPVFGTAGRLAYLAALTLLLAAALHPLGGPPPRELVERAGELWGQQRPLLLVALAALEASSWLHLLQDGDPLPRTPRLLRRLLRRRRPRARRMRR